MVRYHRHDAQFVVNCGFQHCSFVTKSWPAFKMHVRRSHGKDKCDAQVADSDGEPHCTEDITDCLPVMEIADNNDANDAEKPPTQILLSAAYLLSLETEHNLTQRGIDSVVSTTGELLTHQIALCKAEIEKRLHDAGIHPDVQVFGNNSGFFEGLQTCHLRRKFYRQHCNFVEPHEVYLGRAVTKSKGKITSQKRYGIYVPFKETVKALLSLPEVWHCVVRRNMYENDGSEMRDICNGSYVASRAIFADNPSALQIMLYTDDIEVVNPIGAHVRKHKLTMFYYTLCNIPPEYRSKLSVVQLLAIAKTKDVRRSGVRVLLNDFLQTVKQMSNGGINMEVNGRDHLIVGSLLLVVADTPAAHWLGGFKEGVGFSFKSCRACNASSSTMKCHFSADYFERRHLSEHIQRCADLRSLSKDAAKYWSRQWGINGTSCLMDIPHFDVCTCIVQDPMHLLLEGLIPYELKLLVHYCIFDHHYFTIDWLNSQLNSFQYTYLENDKPELFLKSDVLSESKLKQTAGATFTLCRILPYILSLKIPENCALWVNFLRLLQITFLATCPIVSVNTAAQIAQLVTTHHTMFTELYPKASVTPKMHYMIHLPDQLLKFGPLRHHWCMRFEAKHAFFKGFHLRCFKNLPKSLAVKHQLWMCHKQLGSLGCRNRNFLYDGDIVGEGNNCAFSAVYPDVATKFADLISPDEYCVTTVVYVTKSVKIHGLEFRAGCVIVAKYDDTGMPEFALLHSICVLNDVKFFVVEKLEISYFNSHILSYVVYPSGFLDIVRFVDLHNPWPLSLHTYEGQMCVMNIYGDSCEFLA